MTTDETIAARADSGERVRAAQAQRTQAQAESAAWAEIERLRGDLQNDQLAFAAEPVETGKVTGIPMDFLVGKFPPLDVGDAAGAGVLVARPEAPLADMIDEPGPAIYGAGPGYGPERTAEQLEAVFGGLEDQPGWFNSKQFAKAAAQYAKESSPGGLPISDSAREQSQFLMSPERYAYMQEGPGRAVDLLGGLRESPELAMHFWNKSKGARTTRDDYGDPLMVGAGANYARYGGFAPGAAELMLSPLSPIGRYIQWQNVVPSALKHEARGHSAGSAYEIANAADIAGQRYRLGENPILDIEDRAPSDSIDNGSSPEANRAQRWSDRLDDVTRSVQALSPSTPEELARNRIGSWAPAALGYALDVMYGLTDATLPRSILAGLRQIPGKYAAREAARAVAKSTGVGRTAAKRMIDRAVRATPELDVLQRGAKVAGYRGVPAAAYASNLRPPKLSHLLPASGGLAADELVPEFAVEGAMQASIAPKQRSTYEFVASPALSMTDEEFATQQADKRESAEREAIRMEALDRQSPNEIWNDFRAEQARVADEALAESKKRSQRVWRH